MNTSAGNVELARPGQPTLLETGLPVRELSLLAAADRRAVDPVYGAHRWWARRPPAIMRGLVLAAALSSETAAKAFWATFAASDGALAGLRVHDPFAGGGSTLVEAARLGAVVSGGDIDALAVEIVRHELSPAPAEEVRAVGDQLLSHLGERYRDLYPPDGTGAAPLHYFWIHEVECPACEQSGLLYRNLILARDVGKPGAVVRDQPVTVFCPADLSVHYLTPDRLELRHGGRNWPLAKGTFVAGRYVCPGCGRKSSHRELRTGIAPRRLVAVETTAEGRRRQLRAGTILDHRGIAMATAHLASGSGLQLPEGRLRTDRHDDRPVSFGIETVAQLFGDRQLVVFGAAMTWLNAAELEASVKRAMTLAISNALATNNKLCGYATDYGRLSALFSVRGFPMPALSVELNPLHQDGGRGTLHQCIERVARSATTRVRRHVWSIAKAAPERAELSFPARTHDADVVRIAGAADQAEGPEADLCIFDPPYFDYIAYSELSEFYRAWSSQPTTVDNSLLPQGEDPGGQFGLDFADCLRAAMGRLVEGRPLAFTYHSANPEAWRAIGLAVDDAKLAITALWPLRSDGHMGHHSHPGNCEWDLVVCCRRLTETDPAELPVAVDDWVIAVAPLAVSEIDKTNMALALQWLDRATPCQQHHTALEVARVTPDERRQMIELRKLATDRKERLWARDYWREFDVWQIPVEAPRINVDNRRFVAERKLMEEKLGHDLDPENSPDDERAVEAILLDVGYDVDGDRITGGHPGKDYEALRSDWLVRRQESPFWVRPDGVVRNGNRRLAMLKRLQQEEGLGGFAYVDAVLLDPEEIDEVALFDMEQREQLTENLKVRYTDINLLLAIRAAAEARGIDWYDAEYIDRVAGELQHIIGNDRSYAVVQLNAIKYMDAYLDDSGQPRQYQKLIGQIERFRDVGRAMAQIETGYPDDAPDMLRLLFAAIRAGLPHGTIRELRRMFRLDRERHHELLGEVDEVEQAWESSGNGEGLADPVTIAPDEGDANDDDDEDDSEPPGPNVPNYPKDDVADAVDNALDGFRAGQTDDVVKTLRQVRNRLDVLTDDRARLAQALVSSTAEQVQAAFEAVVDWVDAHRGFLG